LRQTERERERERERESWKEGRRIEKKKKKTWTANLGKRTGDSFTRFYY
jgi:hypothetical protein